MSTKSTKTPDLDDELRPEYDLSELTLVGRGVYAEQYHADDEAQTVKLDKDVWTYFQTSEAVNNALRMLIQVAQKAQPA